MRGYQSVDWDAQARRVEAFIQSATPGARLHIHARRRTGKTTFVKAQALKYGCPLVTVGEAQLPVGATIIFVDEPVFLDSGFWSAAARDNVVVVSVGTGG